MSEQRSQMSAAQTIVRFILAAPSCGQARAGNDCTCGCVAQLARAVEERLEAELAQGILEHRGEICTTYPTGKP